MQSVKQVSAALALTIMALAVVSTAHAAVTATAGNASTLSGYNHAADFEGNTALSNSYAEGGLSFIATGSANNNGCGYAGIDCYDAPADLSPWFSGNYLATAGSNAYISIRVSDGRDFQAIEFAVGSGYLNRHGYWSAFRDGLLTGSGNFSGASVLALQDNAGFDEVRLYAFANANRSTGFSAPALDNVRVLAVPEPASWATLLAGLALVGWWRRRPGS